MQTRNHYIHIYMTYIHTRNTVIEGHLTFQFYGLNTTLPS